MYKGGDIMAITISPLDLLLDDENPRFVVLNNREQNDIRKYLVTYEDVCQLANDINDYGGILPGERIVVLKRRDRYVVVEGNRRTCSLQLLLSPDLIPEGFQHKIPSATDDFKRNCTRIEVDTVPNREAALKLMTKRHIDGVKQWKPLAKKQFFASNYQAGQSVFILSRVTGIKESDIKADIRDYKLFYSAYKKYCESHSEYEKELVDLKIDPFLRMFKAKFLYNGSNVKPTAILKITYDDEYNTLSALPNEIFAQIVQMVFYETIVTERLNTRNTLKDVPGVINLLDSQSIPVENVVPTPASNNTCTNTMSNLSGNTSMQDGDEIQSNPSMNTNSHTENDSTGSVGTDSHTSNVSARNAQNVNTGSSTNPSYSGPTPTGGPAPGGPAPRSFFETLSWEGKLFPENPKHNGLLASVHELFYLSTYLCNRKKAYEIYPVATGMVLRTAYEQVLRLRLEQINLWGQFMSTVRNSSFPTLKEMETFIDNGSNRQTVLPNRKLTSAMTSIITYSHREFLNANIHDPGAIRVTPDALVGIAQGGMFTLIQDLINML